MNFDSSQALRKATGRAKSDVANKLVSMFLHEVSRRACEVGGSSVASADYLACVLGAFGHRCLYCNRDLEHDRAVVEHLDGMNRFRVGLHVPGNVAVACRRCNSEKRRDDQQAVLHLAPNGWGSFLSHDTSRCDVGCKTCNYWTSVWPDDSQRKEMLLGSQARIQDFRKPFTKYIAWSDHARSAIQSKVEGLYRACQAFATNEIDKLTSELTFDFATLE
ncbi:MAG: hypothetical protein NTX35_13175 [Verrucomicrobia bacterium]|nr:hypothetical protein [Verrucomicrobiota bacterium]